MRFRPTSISRFNYLLGYKTPAESSLWKLHKEFWDGLMTMCYNFFVGQVYHGLFIHDVMNLYTQKKINGKIIPFISLINLNQRSDSLSIAGLSFIFLSHDLKLCILWLGSYGISLVHRNPCAL